MQAPKTSLSNWQDLRGQVVVLEFWATWCDACVSELPHLNTLVERFKDRPVRFISITDEPEATVREFLKTHQVAGWIGLDTDGSAFAAFGVHGRPLTLVLDRDGYVYGQTFPSLLKPDMIEEVLHASRAR